MDVAVNQKERPILFDGDMVRAILEGRKTQTRRIVKAWKDDGLPSFVSGAMEAYCPHGEQGDRLWVRETWAVRPLHDDLPPRDIPPGEKVYYTATPELGLLNCEKRRPSIHMPRWASRITLEVKDVRVERLQDINEEDAKAEGVWHKSEDLENGMTYNYRTLFAELWESIYGKGSWYKNPWVWVIEFEQI